MCRYHAHCVTASLPVSPVKATPMGQLPALAPASAGPRLAAHQQPDGRPAEPTAALLAAAPHGHHGAARPGQQARLDLVGSAFTGRAAPGPGPLRPRACCRARSRISQTPVRGRHGDLNVAPRVLPSRWRPGLPPPTPHPHGGAWLPCSALSCPGRQLLS